MHLSPNNSQISSDDCFRLEKLLFEYITLNPRLTTIEIMGYMVANAIENNLIQVYHLIPQALKNLEKTNQVERFSKFDYQTEKNKEVWYTIEDNWCRAEDTPRIGDDRCDGDYSHGVKWWCGPISLYTYCSAVLFTEWGDRARV